MGFRRAASSACRGSSHEHVGLDVVCLTVGEDEVKAWTIKRNTCARDAAGAIHTPACRDLRPSRGHPRTDTFMTVRSLKLANAQNLIRLAGKTEIVNDGDILPRPRQRLGRSATFGLREHSSRFFLSRAEKRQPCCRAPRQLPLRGSLPDRLRLCFLLSPEAPDRYREEEHGAYRDYRGLD